MGWSPNRVGINEQHAKSKSRLYGRNGSKHVERYGRLWASSTQHGVWGPTKSTANAPLRNVPGPAQPARSTTLQSWISRFRPWIPVGPHPWISVGPSSGISVGPSSGISLGSSSGFWVGPCRGLPLWPCSRLPIRIHSWLPVQPIPRIFCHSQPHCHPISSSSEARQTGNSP